MKTTNEISDELFSKAKDAAAPHPDRSGWRSVFGLTEPKSVEGIDQIVTEELEQVDASEWDRSPT